MRDLVVFLDCLDVNNIDKFCLWIIILFKGEMFMSNLIFIGEEVCGGLLPLVKVVVQLIKILMIVIPIALIVMGTIDLGKAVLASEEKEIKTAQSLLIKRLIYAAIIFFVPMLVGVIMNIVAVGGEGDTKTWQDCWRAAK